MPATRPARSTVARDAPLAARTGKGAHVDLKGAALVGLIGQPTPVRRKAWQHFGGRRRKKNRRRARRPSADRVAFHRQHHQVQAGRGAAILVKCQELAAGMPRHRLLLVRAVGESRRLARAVRVDPVEIDDALLRSVGAEHDPLAIRRPHGESIVPRIERQLRERVARPVVHPDITLLAVRDLHRELLAVGRESRIRPAGLRRAKW